MSILNLLTLEMFLFRIRFVCIISSHLYRNYNVSEVNNTRVKPQVKASIRWLSPVYFLNKKLLTYLTEIVNRMTLFDRLYVTVLEPV